MELVEDSDERLDPDIEDPVDEEMDEEDETSELDVEAVFVEVVEELPEDSEDTLELFRLLDELLTLLVDRTRLTHVVLDELLGSAGLQGTRLKNFSAWKLSCTSYSWQESGGHWSATFLPM